MSVKESQPLPRPRPALQKAKKEGGGGNKTGFSWPGNNQFTTTGSFSIIMEPDPVGKVVVLCIGEIGFSCRIQHGWKS